jgi:hypothetical protein
MFSFSYLLSKLRPINRDSVSIPGPNCQWREKSVNESMSMMEGKDMEHCVSCGDFPGLTNVCDLGFQVLMSE